MLVVVPLMFIYKRVQSYYLATSRELKRLDATTKSPIFASFQETLGGVATIRAYRQSHRFVAENEARVDRNQEAFYPSINCNRWLAVRLEVSWTCAVRYDADTSSSSGPSSSSRPPHSRYSRSFARTRSTRVSLVSCSVTRFRPPR